MQIFPVGKVYDFMKYRGYFVAMSTLINLAAIAMLVGGYGKLGTDFRGGTEVEVAFLAPVTTQEISTALTTNGFSQPDIIKVEDPGAHNRYLLRVQDVSTLSEETQTALRKALCVGEGHAPDYCPPERLATELKVSPGGDKVTLRYRQPPDLAWVKERAVAVPGIRLRAGDNNPLLQNSRDNRVEVQLESKGDQLMGALRTVLGPEKAPEHALRVEWIGPKAGAQLRASAIKSVLISLMFIMIYVAFRFDVRFAPGGVIALLHDALGALAVTMIFGREVTLTTVAALLTIVGYSINDTVVVYDRVRENLPKMRGATFREIVNVSTSEMLGRTLISSGTVIFSMMAFFVWGTGTLKDFALTLVAGLFFGVYSSVYIALPITEYFDNRFFARVAPKKAPGPARPRGEAVV